MLLPPAGTIDHLADAFGQAVAADPEPARGKRVGLGDHVEAQIGRIQPELFGDLVELDFLAEARLGRAVAALGTAGGLVRKHPAGLELEARQFISERRQHAGVERARRSVGTVAAAVEQSLQVHGGQLALLAHAGAEFHQYRVPAAVQVEHFFARQADFHRPPEHQRRFGHHNFMIRRIALAAEPAAVVAGDHADMRRRYLQRPRQLAMQIVRILRARPKRELAVAVARGERGVLLHRHMGVALEEEHVLEYVVRLRQRLLDIAELERLVAMDVARLAIVVNARLRMRQSFLGRGNRRQRLIFHFDQFQRLGCRLFVFRDHCRHRIADIAHALGRERVLVLRHRHDAVGNGKIAPGQHQLHARMAFSARDVDRFDSSVRMRRAQQLRVEHARQREVVGVAQLARHLGAAVDAAPRMPDDIEFLPGAHAHDLVSPTVVSLILRAASSTESTIC